MAVNSQFVQDEVAVGSVGSLFCRKSVPFRDMASEFVLSILLTNVCANVCIDFCIMFLPCMPQGIACKIACLFSTLRGHQLSSM